MLCVYNNHLCCVGVYLVLTAYHCVRMKTAQTQYLDAFKDELTSFVDRIKRRAQAKVEAAMREVEEVCKHLHSLYTPTCTHCTHPPAHTVHTHLHTLYTPTCTHCTNPPHGRRSRSGWSAFHQTNILAKLSILFFSKQTF